MTPPTGSSPQANRAPAPPRQPLAFVLLSTQRSGSTWVIDTLDSHPAVVAYSELFLEGGQGRPHWGGAKDVVFWRTFAEGASDAESRETRLRRYLRHVLDRQDTAAAGFKLMYGQAGAHPELLPLLTERGARALHLVRHNGLDVLLSHETAWARGQYHARDGEPVEPVRLRLDPTEAVRRVAEHERAVKRGRALLAHSGLRALEIGYEDLRSGATSFATLLDFLDVAPGGHPLSSTLLKLNPDRHRTLVENHAEVAAALEAHGYGHLLR